jgi:hypothetical protein
MACPFLPSWHASAGGGPAADRHQSASSVPYRAAGGPGRVASAVQVLDIPAAALTVTEYQMMARACGCGRVTAAAPPPGVAGGPVCYGPNVTDAATLLASTDVIGIERAADLMGALFKAPVSTGFVSRCLERLDAA